MANIGKDKVTEMAHQISAYHTRCRLGYGLQDQAGVYLNANLTPLRFRTDIRRAAVSQGWLNALRDLNPGMSDAVLDTATSRALRECGFPADHWVLTQPLKR